MQPFHENNLLQALWENSSNTVPDDAAVKQGEDEVEGDGAPCDEVVHPRPEVCL